MSKPSDMKPIEARQIIEEVYGHRGQTKAAADMRRGEVTVSRWLTGTTPIDTMSCLWLRLMLCLYRKGINWRKWVSDYEGEEHPEYSQKINVEDII